MTHWKRAVCYEIRAPEDLREARNVRIWDIAAGYLSRQSLLGEHREVHALYVILSQGRAGYAHHPETRRWRGALNGLSLRHAQLVAEMRLRGYAHQSPLPPRRGRTRWPAQFIDEPGAQLAILARKYAGRTAGRIPLPRDAQALWAQHKYSVMARDPAAYRQFGRGVARRHTPDAMPALARELVMVLHEEPASERLVNALEHMWGHVREFAEPAEKQRARQGPVALLAVIQALAARERERFLWASTALSELAVHAEREWGSRAGGAGAGIRG